MQLKHIFIVLAAFCFGALIAVWLYALENATGDMRVQTTGKTLIGGPFNLTDHTGAPRSDKDFRGKYMLIYFGYSFCPDICPTDLQKMTRALNLVGADASKIQPIFITIDPERDTPEQMKSYVSNFHPTMIGLTGSLSNIDAVKKSYKVYGVKVDENGKPSKNIVGTDYLMDHSPQTFFMDPNGKFISYFRFSTTAEQMATTIIKVLKNTKVTAEKS